MRWVVETAPGPLLANFRLLQLPLLLRPVLKLETANSRIQAAGYVSGLSAGMRTTTGVRDFCSLRDMGLRPPTAPIRVPSLLQWKWPPMWIFLWAEKGSTTWLEPQKTLKVKLAFDAVRCCCNPYYAASTRWARYSSAHCNWLYWTSHGTSLIMSTPICTKVNPGHNSSS